jgi:hypothetical protein
MNYEALKFWLEAFLVFWNVAGSAYLLVDRRSRRNDVRIADLQKAMAEKVDKTTLEKAKVVHDKEVEDRKSAHDKAAEERKVERDKACEDHKRKVEVQEKGLRRLHEEIAHLPSRSEIQELANSMRALGEKIGNLDGRMSGVNRAVDLMNQFLIEQGGKR